MHGNSKHWVGHQNTHKIDKGSEEPAGGGGGSCLHPVHYCICSAMLTIKRQLLQILSRNLFCTIQYVLLSLFMLILFCCTIQDVRALKYI